MKYKRSIHRTLILRLAIATLCISAVLSTTVAFIQFSIVDDRVIDRAMPAVERLRWIIMENLDAPGLGDHERIRQIVQRPASDRMRTWDGHFVLTRILDLDFKEIAKATDDTYPHIAAVSRYTAKGFDRSSLAREGTWRKMKVLRKDVVFIHLASELKNSADQRAAYIESVFVLSPEVLAQTQKELLFTTLIAAGIVLLTALILYPVIVRLLRRVTSLSADLLHANMEILSVLGSTIAKRDSDTDIHNYRVTIYAVRIAQELRLDDDEIRALLKGAFLHDVGKIGISDNILMKPGKLTPEEFEEMKKHVRYGVDIVNRSTWLSDAVDIVGSHHEKYDGTGYDKNKRDGEIPRIARIFAVADVFDALTSKRPYKEPLGLDESMKILMENRGAHFDPEVLDAFVKIAPSLYEGYANRTDDKPRQDLDRINAQYYHPDLISYIR
ncbi:MAG TPA: HD-GYP domain-containing protein [Syntrophorhabdaceae bacterium]|nr:HD-GYP domain-containing protein [Syntrophorhabdaceae bacterium]